MTEAVFGLLGVLLGALVSGVVMWTVARRDRIHGDDVARADRHRRHVAARKDQWWVRTQWALDLVMLDSDRHRMIGLELLQVLGSSSWADVRELDIIRAAAASVIDALDSDPGMEETGGHGA